MISTVSALPAYAALENNGQDFVYTDSTSALLDDPREPGSADVPDVTVGVAARNGVGRNGYHSVVDIVFTADPPAIVRVGVIVRGTGEDAMSAVQIARADGAVGATALRTGAEATSILFFDLERAQAGQRFTVSLAKGAFGTLNNVAYLGLTFDSANITIAGAQ